MNSLKQPTIGQERRTIAGLDVGGGVAGLSNFLAVAESRSTSIDDYTPLLMEAAATGEFPRLAAALLASMDDDSLSGKGAYQAEDQIELCRDEVKTVLLVKVPEMDIRHSSVTAGGGHQFARTQLDVLPNDASFLFLGNGTMQLRLLQVAADSEGERLKDCGVATYTNGDVLTVRRSNDAFDTLSVAGTVWLLQVVINEHSDLVYHYDRDSLLRHGVSSANFHASRMEFVMDIFKHFPAEGALDMLEQIYDSSRFYFVRWKAVQTLLRMDLQRGTDVLMRAGSDAHSQVRLAARRTIQNLHQHGHI